MRECISVFAAKRRVLFYVLFFISSIQKQKSIAANARIKKISPEILFVCHSLIRGIFFFDFHFTTFFCVRSIKATGFLICMFRMSFSFLFFYHNEFPIGIFGLDIIAIVNL